MNPQFLLICFLLVNIGCNNSEQKSGNSDVSINKREKGSYSRVLTWSVDTTHSSILFKTKHTANHDVIGWLSSYDIKIISQRFDFSDAKINARFRMNSIIMPNPEMATNVMSPLFLNSDDFPEALFKGKSVEYYDDNKFIINGEFTLMEVTKPLKLDVRFNGFAHPIEHGLPGFTVYGKFSRFDFGVQNKDTLISNNELIINDTIRIEGNFRLLTLPD